MPQSGKFVYKIIDDKTAGFGTGNTSSNCNGFTERGDVSGYVVIPCFIENYRITRLLSFSVRNCNNITKIKLPNTLTSIEYGALTCLSGIKEVTIPASVVSIADNNDALVSVRSFKFEKESRLKTIGAYFIRRSPYIEEITLPSSVVSIGSYFAEDCASLKRVSYCGSTAFSSIASAFDKCTNQIDVFVSYEYTAASFGGKSITKKTYDVCCGAYEKHFSCASKIRNYVYIRSFALLLILSF